MQRGILITAAAPGKSADFKLTVALIISTVSETLNETGKEPQRSFFYCSRKEVKQNLCLTTSESAILRTRSSVGRAREQGSTTEPQARTSRARAFFRNNTLHSIKG